MELITAIALLCQINLGTGEGRASFTIERIADEQKACQKELATCISKTRLPSLNDAIYCLKDRK